MSLNKRDCIVPNIELLEYDFKKGEMIGSGSFGSVFNAYSKKMKGFTALKVLHNDPTNFNNESNNEFIREVKIAAKLNHENIIRFFGITKDPVTELYCMVFQFANNGNLRDYLKNHFHELGWPDKIRMAKEIASGINYLHSEKFVHRDLHDKNVLVHDGILMIADFGLSKSLESNSLSVKGGTPAYSDPQYISDLDNFKRKEPSDIYSLGVLFWELSSGETPFKNMKDNEIILHVVSGGREIPINGTPVDFINLYIKAWDGNPNLRPTIKEVCNYLDSM